MFDFGRIVTFFTIELQTNTFQVATSIVELIWLLDIGKIDDSKARLSGCLKDVKVTVF
jgi:hypothetical protein